MYASLMKITFRSAVFALPFLVASSVYAGEGDCATKNCPVAKKVTALLSSWETASAEAGTLTAAQQKDIAGRAAKLKGECPVGARVATTLVTVRDVLGLVIAVEAENAKHCPLSKTAKTSLESTGVVSDEACASAKGLKAARTAALGGLHQLANQAAGFMSNAACCASSSKTTAVAASTKKAESCATACSKSGTAMASCPIRVASRVGELKASWQAGAREATALSVEKRREIFAGMKSLSADSKAVALVPETVLTLADGFDALGKIHMEMGAWAQANPEFMKTLPEESMRNFQLQMALIDETRDVLSLVRQTIMTMSEAQVETASKS